jgi:hypothetical protein
MCENIKTFRETIENRNKLRIHNTNLEETKCKHYVIANTYLIMCHINELLLSYRYILLLVNCCQLIVKFGGV